MQQCVDCVSDLAHKWTNNWLWFHVLQQIENLRTMYSSHRVVGGKWLHNSSCWWDSVSSSSPGGNRLHFSLEGSWTTRNRRRLWKGDAALRTAVSGQNTICYLPPTSMSNWAMFSALCSNGLMEKGLQSVSHFDETLHSDATWIDSCKRSGRVVLHTKQLFGTWWTDCD